MQHACLRQKGLEWESIGLWDPVWFKALIAAI